MKSPSAMCGAAAGHVCSPAPFPPRTEACCKGARLPSHSLATQPQQLLFTMPRPTSPAATSQLVCTSDNEKGRARIHLQFATGLIASG